MNHELLISVGHAVIIIFSLTLE